MRRGSPGAAGDQHLSIVFIYLFVCLCIYILKSSPKDMFIDFRKTGKETKRETLMLVRNISQVPPVCPLTRDQTCSLGMCPDQDLNPQPFGVRNDTPTN